MTKNEANDAGIKLINRLKGKSWKLRVWENFGWHYSAYTKNVSVHTANDGTFFAFVGKGGTGMGIWTQNQGGYYRDPNKAVLVAINRAQKVVTELQDLVNEARAVIQGY